MRSHNVSISGVGYCSSFGGFKDSCAAARAGIMRLSPHESVSFGVDGEEDGEALVVARIPEYLDGYQGYGRITKMLQFAYRDLCKNIGMEVPSESTKILLAIPDPLDRGIKTNQLDETQVKNKRLLDVVDKITEPLFSTTNPKLKSCDLQCKFGDRVAFARILEKALNYISCGEVDHCLLMVADTHLSTDNLTKHLYDNDLKSPKNPVGFVPGEGAAMLLLSSNNSQVERGLPLNFSINIASNPVVSDSAIDSANNIFPPVCECLRREGSNNTLPQIISDVNGTEKKALELSQLQLKIKQRYPNSSLADVVIPSLSFGEIGALFGAYSLGYIFDSVMRSYSLNSAYIIILSELLDGKSAVIKVDMDV